jgi:hypothetical protein
MTGAAGAVRVLGVALCAMALAPGLGAADPLAPVGLAQLPGHAGCLGGISFPALGIPNDHCTPLAAFSGMGTLVFAGPNRGRSAAMSPDGRFVYMSSRGAELNARRHRYDSAIIVLARDASDGSLHELADEAGCVSELRRHQCAGGRALDHISALAVSPDGRNLYAVANLSNGITVFRRDPVRGAVTQLPRSAGCVALGDTPTTGRCRRGIGIGDPDSVLVSPDGRNVYVGGNWGGATTMAAFARNPTTGALRQLIAPDACLTTRQRDTPGCALVRGLSIFGDATQSPDGRFVYWSNIYGNGPVLGFARDVVSGALTPVRQLCIACVPESLQGSAVIAPAGGDAYVFAGEHGLVYHFVRDLLTGRLVPAPQPIAFRCSPRGRCSEGRIVLDDSGTAGYLVSPQGIVALRRDPATGALAQVAGPSGCVVPARQLGCIRGRAYDGASDILVSPDARNAYSVSDYSIGVYRRIEGLAGPSSG